MVLEQARKLRRARAWKKEQMKLLVKIVDSITARTIEEENGDEEEDVAVEADGVTDELSRVEEVLDDEQFEIDTEFVDTFPGNDDPL